jgi:hypothetical protein
MVRRRAVTKSRTMKELFNLSDIEGSGKENRFERQKQRKSGSRIQSCRLPSLKSVVPLWT